MELYEIKVETQPSVTLSWDETIILPIGDIQYGTEGVHLEKFRRWINWGVSIGAYFTGLGDYLDVASPSGRAKLKNDDLYDSVRKALDDQAMTHLDTMKRVLEPTQGRWLVLNKGHHYWEFLQGGHKGRDTDDLLAEFLGCHTAEAAAITQLKFKGEGSNSRHSVNCQIWSHHGEGSGMTMAAPLNKLERMMSRFPTVDIFLMGHYSRKVGYPIDALVPYFGKHPRLLAKRRILAVTGGFMSGYTVGVPPSYVEKAMMPPTNLGAPVLYARPVHGDSEDRLDLNILL